ncbi:MAG: DHH family phosphoesterase [Coprococcus sp.]
MNNILSCLEGAKTVMIAGHTRPDGDCVGACMGLWHYIRDNYPYIQADVRLEPVPDSYKVIAGVEQIISDYEDDRTYDLFIALDASDKERLAGAKKYFDTAEHTICIDHHISNPGYADENLIAAGCQLYLRSADRADGIWTAISYDAAVALYIGIICDTGVFKYSCTSHRYHGYGRLPDGKRHSVFGPDR